MKSIFISMLYLIFTTTLWVWMDFLTHNNKVSFGFIAQEQALLSLCGLFQFLKVSKVLDCSGRIIYVHHFHQTYSIS